MLLLQLMKSTRMNTNVLIKTLVLAGLVASASSTKAIPIYDNLGAASGGADPVAPYGPLYDSFTSSGSIQAITGLQLALYGPGGAGTITVGLFSDSSTAPGALIATLGTIDDATISAGINDYTLSLVSDPLLAASTRYWIGLSDTGQSTSWAWSLDVSGTGVSGEYFANQNRVWPNNTYGPYQMTLSIGSVPEAGSTTAYLFGLGVAGLVVLRRKLA
jgi:hypothetical protein